MIIHIKRNIWKSPDAGIIHHAGQQKFYRIPDEVRFKMSGDQEAWFEADWDEKKGWVVGKRVPKPPEKTYTDYYDGG